LYYHLFSLSLTRPPPTSPLFPYTTLFRSYLAPRLAPQCPNAEHLVEDIGAAHPTFGEPGVHVHGCGQLRVPHPRLPLRWSPSDRDRKSTRLNSSHRTISYAVFCLKKKTHM